MTDQTTLIVIIAAGCILLVVVLVFVNASFIFYNSQKKKLSKSEKERDELRRLMTETGQIKAYDLQQMVANLERKKAQTSSEIDDLKTQFERQKGEFNQQIGGLSQQIDSKKNELIVLDDEILLQSFGFYKPRYELQNAQAYKMKLDQIRSQQAAMVKSGEAASGSTSWTINNNRKEGARMVKDYVKLILRSFNNECDASIINVKFNNVNQIEKKIRNAYDTLNKLGQRMTIAISNNYLGLKLQELYLVYEYQVKKQEEKEEQRRIREEMREEAKILKEIEDMKIKIEKEETHFSNALQMINEKIEKAQTDADLNLLEQEKASIEQELAKVEKDKQDVLNWEQHTRAGYVYIISNVGSFGENIYKIGVTRRLDPTERVDELGGASVPFNFDIHATIFSDNAPALENALHKAFEHRRINMINYRREFFNVTLDEIERVVKTNFEKPVEFVRLPDASEYRQSQKLRETTVA